MEHRPVAFRPLLVSLMVLAGIGFGVRAEGLEEKPWKFEGENRRDPFAFTLKIVEEHTPQPPPVAANSVVPATYYAEAVKAFFELTNEDKVRETLAKCDAGLKILAEDPNTSENPWKQELRENLLDLRKAAQRVSQRIQTEKKFKAIDLRLTGIVRRSHGSQAIVNNRTVRKGDVVAAADSSVVVLDEIRTDEVVVVFEGFRMSLSLAENSK